MRIQFFRPQPPAETIGLQHVMVVEPLELEILATLVEKEHEVEIVDLILENHPAGFFIKRFNPHVVCVTGYITHTNQMARLCKEAKTFNSSITTIVGGVYIEKMPENIDSKHIDYRVIRNATEVFPELISFIGGATTFPKGVLKTNETNFESNLSPYSFTVPLPNRQLTQKYRNRYFYVFHNKVALLKTSFGCPFPCSFCFCRKITSDHYAERDLADVIAELKTIREKEVYIIDDNFLVSEKRVAAFLRLLNENKINKRYLIYGRADFIASHSGLMAQFKKQGLRTVIVGFESFTDSELGELNKKTLAQINEKAMQVLNSNRIDCYASVIAMPGWDKADFDRATKKMIELKIRFLNIQPLTPLEKTDIVFDDRQLIIQRNEYEKWDLAHVTVQPEKLSVTEFYNQILRMYQRVLFRPSNLISHLKYSPLMQIKLLIGAIKVRNQYIRKIKCLK